MNILFEIVAAFNPLFDFFGGAIGYIATIALVMILVEKCRAHFASKRVTLKRRRQYY